MKGFILFAVIGLVLSSCTSVQRGSRQLDKNEKDIFQKETLLRTDTNYIEDKYKDALAYCYDGKVKKGLFLLKKQIDQKSNKSQYWNNIGSCYYLYKRYDKAMFYYKLGLSFNKNDYQILNNISLVYIEKKQYHKAFNLLKDVNSKSNFLVTKFNLASLYFYFSKYQKSISLIQELYAQNQEDPDLNLLLAKNYLFLGQHPTADKYFTNIPERYFKDNEIANLYSYNLTKMGKYDEAKKALKHQRKPSSRKDLHFKNNISLLIDEKVTEQEAMEKQRELQAKEARAAASVVKKQAPAPTQQPQQPEVKEEEKKVK